MYERIFYLLLAETRDVFYVQTMFEEENAEHLHISLILHFSTSPILQLPLSSKIVQSTCTPILLPDRYFISSDSLQKPGMVTPQFSQASKTVPLFSTQGLWHKQISPELWCSRWVVWLWSYVIDSELLPKPTSISITHLLKRVNNPGTEAAKWKAAFTTRSRRCNKAMILTFWLGRGGWEDALPLTWEY